jgi:hypothetical protein
MWGRRQSLRPLSGLRGCDYVRASVRDLSVQLALYFREMFAGEHLRSY